MHQHKVSLLEHAGVLYHLYIVREPQFVKNQANIDREANVILNKVSAWNTYICKADNL